MGQLHAVISHYHYIDTIDLDNLKRVRNSKIQKNKWNVMDFEYLFPLFLI